MVVVTAYVAMRHSDTGVVYESPVLLRLFIFHWADMAEIYVKRQYANVARISDWVHGNEAFIFCIKVYNHSIYLIYGPSEVQPGLASYLNTLTYLKPLKVILLNPYAHQACKITWKTSRAVKNLITPKHTT